jgi:hypothetical protein
MSDVPAIHDVFISYAHIDDQPGRGVEYGWVSNLHYTLERALSRQLGDHCSIWFDRSELRGNRSVTPEIAAKLAQARTLVVILSPSFVGSEWCLRELAIFCERFRGAVSRRLFVVDIGGMDREQMGRIGLADLATYPFCYRDLNKRMRTYGNPEPRSEEPEYYRLVDDLATDIAEFLKSDRTVNHDAQQSRPPSAPVASAGSWRQAAFRYKSEFPATPVVLAEVTDDLKPLRQKLRRYLEQAGQSVRLLHSYGMNAREFQRDAREQIERAGLFVQLLSEVSSEPLPDLPEGYATWQHRYAKECKAEILQWRDPSTMPESVDDPGHRELLLGETVNAVSFESLTGLVLTVIAERVRTPSPSPLGAAIFINFEKSDQAFASRITDYVRRYAGVFLPITSGRPDEIRRNTEENIVECDGLIVIYGNGSPIWVQQQLRLYNKLAPRRQTPIRLLAIVDAPPDDKPDVNVHLPGMRMLNCRTGFNEALLEDALGNLTQAWRQ